MNFPLFFVPIGFMLFCSYMTAHAVGQYRLARASAGWPTATGTLETVLLWGARNINGAMVEAERLSVSYRFMVDGNMYIGTHVAYYQLHYPETVDFASAHPQHSEIKVHYNPAKPSDAVLISGPHPTKPYGPVVIAVCGVLASTAVVFAAWFGVLN